MYMSIQPIQRSQRRRFGFILALAILLYICAVIAFIIAY